MSQPKKAFNEVRAILGKLDRSREELRQQPGSQNTPALTPQTIGTGATPAAQVPAPPPRANPGAQAAPTLPTPSAAPTPGSKYGRAQPIRPAGNDNALGRWKAPGQ